MPSFIDEYLVKLGAAVDQSGMNRFQNALRDAAAAVDATAIGMSTAFFKAQTEIVSGFLAIGSAVVGLADKTAMADQEYRLFALHMYMSKDAARGLKVAMDSLGQPLENLMWDPELRGRTHQLLEDQRAMAPAGDYDAQMRKIRDVRFEFTRMEVELQYLGMHVVQDFMKSLGLGPDMLLKKLQDFNRWVINDMPAISQKIVHWFMPIWYDMKDVVRSVGEALYDTGVAFQNLVGLFTGDQSIMGATTDMEKLAKATQGASGMFADFAETVAQLEDLLAHLVSGVALMAGGEFSEAGVEFKAALNDVSAKMLLGTIGAMVGAKSGHPLIGAAAGVAMGTGLDRRMGIGSTEDWFRTLVGAGKGQYDVNPDLARAIFMQESGMRQTDANGNLVTSHDKNGKPVAYGISQLTAGTAKGLGVDPSDLAQNMAGGLALMKHYMDEYHDAATAVAAYHEGDAKMRSILAGKATLSPEARSEVVGVMQRMGKYGDTHIGSIVVHVDKPNAVNSDVAHAVADRLRAEQNKATQRNLQEFTQQAWSY